MPNQLPVLHPTIADFAARFALPAAVVQAIVQVESAGNVYAWRVEPQYKFLWNVREKCPFLVAVKNIGSERAPDEFPFFPAVSSRDTEWWGQQSSWGPMQVMGAVAREFGYVGPFPALCSADNGIKYGCLLLQRLRDQFLANHGWAGVVASYNAGSPLMDERGVFRNQQYVDRVAFAGVDFQVLP